MRKMQEEAEERYHRKKKRGRQRMLVVLAWHTALFLTVLACVWVFRKAEGDVEPVSGSAGEVIPDGDAAAVLSGSVGYSQEEVEKREQDAGEAAVAAVLGNIRTGLDAGEGVLQTLRPLYPDELIVYSGGKYNFVPINRSLKMHSYEAANLKALETGEYQYLQGGEVISRKGIDVSRHQGKIDWSLVAQDGVEFAFIRVGYRGYGTGKVMEDDRFIDNIKGALQAGIRVGVYFYSQAVSEEEALEEAAFVLERVAPYQIDCPVVFDVERVAESEGEGRMNAISREERTAIALRFCQAIEEAGYRPMLYYNTEMGAMMLDLEALEGYDKWFAAYSDIFYYPYDHKIWQYSQSGRVQGIQGDVDLNISFAPLWEE